MNFKFSQNSIFEALTFEWVKASFQDYLCKRDHIEVP